MSKIQLLYRLGGSFWITHSTHQKYAVVDRQMLCVLENLASQWLTPSRGEPFKLIATCFFVSSRSRRFECLTLLIPAACLIPVAISRLRNQPIHPFSGTRAVRKPINLLKNFCRRLLRLALKPSEAHRLLTTTPKLAWRLGLPIRWLSIRCPGKRCGFKHFRVSQARTTDLPRFSFVRILLYQAASFYATLYL